MGILVTSAHFQDPSDVGYVRYIIDTLSRGPFRQNSPDEVNTAELVASPGIKSTYAGSLLHPKAEEPVFRVLLNGLSLEEPLLSSGYRAEKGTRFNLPERPGGCFAQIKPGPFFGSLQ